MRPATFDAVNAVLHPPQELEETATALAVHDDGQQLVSLWRPTWRERWSMFVFGRVWIGVAGRAHPPIWIEARRSVFNQKTKTEETT